MTLFYIKNTEEFQIVFIYNIYCVIIVVLFIDRIVLDIQTSVFCTKTRSLLYIKPSCRSMLVSWWWIWWIVKFKWWFVPTVMEEKVYCVGEKSMIFLVNVFIKLTALHHVAFWICIQISVAENFHMWLVIASI